MNAPRAAPARRRVCLGLLVLASLLAGTWLGRGAEPRPLAERHAALLQRAPSGGRAQRLAWLEATARGTADAQLALLVMEQLAAEASGAQALRAVLWQVRYWMARGEPANAAALLEALTPPHPESEAAAEYGYWRALCLGEAWAAAGSGNGSASPWSGWTQVVLAGLGDDARAALAVEGIARREGLLGPWLWTLQESGEPWLGQTGARIGAAESATLARAPEGALLSDRTRGAVPAAAPLLPVGGRERLPVTIPPPATRRFAVVVGTFDGAGTAGGLAAELERHGFPARAVPLGSPGDSGVVRVELGPCRSVAEAESLGAALAERLLLPFRIVEVP